uniref:Pcdhgc3 protein n=1 Tax=Mus musculus TaxID=10090 RepID=Q4KMN6_MOUSE|nr:Pcdhgc3 protein [Mus musculus]
MVAEARSSGLVSPWRTVGVLLLLAALTEASTIIHYEILEERERGFPVGNVVTDLGLDLGSLSARRLRVVSGASRRFFEVKVQVSDINDNPPQSSQSSYDVYVEENNLPGVPILNLSVWDPDAPPNARLSFFLLEPGAETGLVSRYFTINRDNGVLTTLVPLDYEDQREFQLTAHINDGGTPVLATNISVNVFVTDRNDNAPQVLYPRPGQSSVEMLPRGTAAGHVVSRVVGWDADAGHNAWLSYSLLGAPNQSLFAVGLHTGQISTARPIQDTDSPRQILTVLISDSGEPLLSTTATLTVSVTEESPEARAEFPSGSAPREQNKNLTFYLLLSLILVSVGFAVTVLGVIIFKVYKWKRSRDLYRAPVSSLYRTPGPSLHADAVRGGLMPPHLYHQVYLTTDSRRSDPLLKKPGAASPLASRQNTLRSCDPVFYRQVLGAESAPPGQQAPPNTDWRFSQAQRPGTSGSQNGDETGTWPNNQFDTEMLQAMILASASEAADGSSTLGGGAGTMGLSARYGPQFTLQHVPDYRQNVYIPGSNATLTNAAGKRDGKAPAGGNGNKKKSGKKEKK